MNYTYYLSANTSNGYISFMDEYAVNLRKIIILKNITKLAKQQTFDKIINYLQKNDTDYDKIIRCGTATEVDALIINDFSVLVADEGLFVNKIPLYADVVDFGEHLRLDMVIQDELNNIKNKINNSDKKMYKHLECAKGIHDKWEQIYISNMNFEKLNNASDELVNGIFDGLPQSDSVYTNQNRFLGSLIPRDNVNYIENLTDNVAKKIYIKGRPGTGKSTLLKKIISKAKELGYSTETYYCSFDPCSLDMVIIRKIGVALFDSTRPHEVFPTDETGEIFDTYSVAIKDNIDEYCADELTKISSEYNQEIKKAKECLYTSISYKKMIDKILCNKDVYAENIRRIMSMLSFD